MATTSIWLRHDYATGYSYAEMQLDWSSSLGCTGWQLYIKQHSSSTWESTPWASDAPAPGYVWVNPTAGAEKLLTGLSSSILYDFRVIWYFDDLSSISADCSGYVDASRPTVPSGLWGYCGQDYFHIVGDAPSSSSFVISDTGSGLDYVELFYRPHVDLSNDTGWYYGSRIYPSGGTVNLAGTEITGLTPGVSWDFKIIAYDNETNYYGLRWGPWTTLTDQFQWTGGDKVAGTDFNVSAADWQTLVSKINTKRAAKSLSAISTTVVAGTIVKALEINKVIFALNDMSPSVSSLPNVFVGDDITAEILNRLKNSYNSI